MPANIVLLCGDYMSGKTVSSGTFPKPMKWFNYDSPASINSFQTAKNKDNSLVVPDWKEIEVINFFRASKAKLSLTTSMGKGVAPDYAKDYVGIIAEYEKQIDDIFANPTKYKTFVIDSMTSMFRIWGNAVMGHNNKPTLSMADYGTLQSMLFSQFIPTIEALASETSLEWIILIDHITMMKDENTGAILEFPIGTSKETGRLLGQKMTEIWLQQFVGGEYTWRTRKTGFFTAGSRNNFPDPIKPATYKSLIPFIGGK